MSGVTGRAPRICHIGTAGGDQQWFNALFTEAGEAAGMTVTHLNLFPMPSAADPAALLLGQDVVWVGGGSVANLLAVWRLHGLDQVLRKVWQAGVVLGGVSAGSVCWHVGGTTDSFGPDLRPVTNGLGFVPYSAGVHYDSEEQRRPLFQRLIGSGTCPPATRPTTASASSTGEREFAEAVTEVRGKGAYRVAQAGRRRPQEERIEPRVLRRRLLTAAGSRSPAATRSSSRKRWNSASSCSAGASTISRATSSILARIVSRTRSLSRLGRGAHHGSCSPAAVSQPSSRNAAIMMMIQGSRDASPNSRGTLPAARKTPKISSATIQARLTITQPSSSPCSAADRAATRA